MRCYVKHLVCVAFVHCIFFTDGSHTLRLSQSHLSGLIFVAEQELLLVKMLCFLANVI